MKFRAHAFYRSIKLFLRIGKCRKKGPGSLRPGPDVHRFLLDIVGCVCQAASEDGKGHGAVTGNEPGQDTVPLLDLGQLDELVRQGSGDQLVRGGFRLSLDLDSIRLGVGVDLRHIGFRLSLDALTFSLLLGLHRLLLLLDLSLQFLLRGDLLGFDSVREGIGEIDILDGDIDHVDPVSAQFLAQAVTDLDAQLLPEGYQVFRGVF